MTKKQLKTALNRKTYEMRAQILKALANPSRLMVVDILNERGELSAGELLEIVGSDQSTVWKHLSILKQAGLIEDRKEGKRAYYRLVRPCVMNFFQCVEQVMEENLKAQMDVMSRR
jgi:ArsR family transcriptional regulator